MAEENITTMIDLDDKDEIKVDIADDAPPEDRNRAPLPKEIVDELESDDLDEYSEKVKKRLGQMKKVWHDERREKERAAREREEALRFAQQAYEENKQLKQRLGAGEKIFAEETTKAANITLQAAKDTLRRAYESGDAELITDAQMALNEAQFKLKEASSFRPSLQTEDSGVQPTQQVQAPQRSNPGVDAKAEAWRSKNTWFGVDEEMTALALGLHEKLVRSGVDPRSDDYYRRVDETIKKRFPENFEEVQPTQEEKPSSRKSTVVAPSTRSTASRRIQITASAAAIAKRLGVTPEAYAREMMKLENNNG
jgi:hypothetical protein